MQPNNNLSRFSLNASPLVSFHFQVTFMSIGGGGFSLPMDMRFQKVSGFDLSISNMESKRIGGVQVRLPNFPEYSNVTLERGYVVGSNPFGAASLKAFESLEFSPFNILISLLDANSIPVASWLLRGAIPVRWSISDMDAGQSAILIETMELSYSKILPISL